MMAFHPDLTCWRLPGLAAGGVDVPQPAPDSVPAPPPEPRPPDSPPEIIEPPLPGHEPMHDPIVPTPPTSGVVLH